MDIAQIIQTTLLVIEIAVCAALGLLVLLLFVELLGSQRREPWERDYRRPEGGGA